MEQEQINIEDIMQEIRAEIRAKGYACLLYTSPSPRDRG